MRRILAIGGGGFLMESEPSPIDALVLRLTAKTKPRICFVPTPSGDLPEHIEKFYSAFSPEACYPSHLSFFRPPSPGSLPLASFREHLLAQDAIYVGGGNTKSALGVWREWGAGEVFAQAYAVGILLAGVSAGAMCWFEAGLTDSYWGAGYQPLPCLGLLPGGCGVHYHSDPDRTSRLHAAVAVSAVPPSVAIDDFAAVLFENEVVSKAFSWAPGACAYRVALQDGRAAETALKCTGLTREGNPAFQRTCLGQSR
ncbi:MAG: peptidase E [Ideonella sp.]|nr:peptidase E [Ideonella sp.]